MRSRVHSYPPSACRLVVAIDGPAAAGKGTIAQSLAAELGFAYLDSGKIYRALALKADRLGVPETDPDGMRGVAESLGYRDFQDPDTSSSNAARLAARYASSPIVRGLAVGIQRRVAQEALTTRPGIVVDGRDIGTNVFPDAPVKIYVTASLPARAKRRHKELVRRGEDVSFAEVLQDLEKRDHADATRLLHPLRRAEDAVLLDTSEMSIEAAFDAARRIVEAARAPHP